MLDRDGDTYIIVTNDGPGNEEVFLTWTAEDGGYYTTVDCIDEINEFDFHSTIEEAISRAKDANSGTLFGWDAPMKIVELTNFYNAYYDNEYPELVEVQTISFK